MVLNKNLLGPLAGEFGEKIPVLPSQDGGAVFRVIEFSPEGPWIDTVGSSLLLVKLDTVLLQHTPWLVPSQKRTR